MAWWLLIHSDEQHRLFLALLEHWSRAASQTYFTAPDPSLEYASGCASPRSGPNTPYMIPGHARSPALTPTQGPVPISKANSMSSPFALEPSSYAGAFVPGSAPALWALSAASIQQSPHVSPIVRMQSTASEGLDSYVPVTDRQPSYGSSRAGQASPKEWDDYLVHGEPVNDARADVSSSRPALDPLTAHPAGASSKWTRASALEQLTKSIDSAGRHPTGSAAADANSFTMNVEDAAGFRYMLPELDEKACELWERMLQS